MENLEGWRYEMKFNTRGRVSTIVRRPVDVSLADLDEVMEARDSGLISPRDWTHLLDFLFGATAERYARGARH